MNGRERILAFLNGESIDRVPLMPITMMFAVDRIGRKYGEYARDYRVLVEGQIRTAEEFDFDYVSVISDPAREAADLGSAIEYFEDQPPAIDDNNALLADKTVLNDLKIPDPLGGGRLHDRVKAIALFKEKLNGEKLIEGWVEGPCAQGADLRGINTLMLDFYDDPVFIRDLFEFVIDMELESARAQIEAGADLIGIGDAAASLVGPNLYDEFVWPYEKKLVDGLREMGTLIRLHICGKTHPLYEGIGKLGCDIVDLDWMNPMADARQIMGPDQVLLGNLDPVTVIRNGTPDDVLGGVTQCHRDSGVRYIVGAGCEIPRDAPDENVRVLTEYARSHQPESILSS